MSLTECLDPKPFESFGGSRWRVVSKRPVERLPLSGNLKQVRAQIRWAVPNRPGVYGMIDARRELIYVGKSKRLRDRLISYFQTRSRPEKADRIADRASQIVWQCVPDELAALLRELELIHRWRPRFNVQGQPGRSCPSFVCIGRGPAPRVFLARDPNGKESARFGPICGGRFAGRVVQRLNDLAGLRDCRVPMPIAFAEQRQLFEIDLSPRCLRYDLGNCLGPCAARCGESDYARAVRLARDFLAGRSAELPEMLDAQMRQAAEQRQFERAAALRDARLELEWLSDHLERLREIRGRDRFVYPHAEQSGHVTWYFLAAGQVIEAAAAPNSGRTAACRLRMLEKAYRTDPSFLSQGDSTTMDVSALVASWFRNRRQELEHALLPEQAMEICRRMI